MEAVEADDEVGVGGNVGEDSRQAGPGLVGRCVSAVHGQEPLGREEARGVVSGPVGEIGNEGGLADSALTDE